MNEQAVEQGSDPSDVIREAIKRNGGAVVAAKSIGCSAQHLYNVLNGHDSLGAPRVLALYGHLQEQLSLHFLLEHLTGNRRQRG